MFKKNQGGFTLIELIIVIVILGILAAIAIPKFVSIRAKEQQIEAREALGSLRSGITIFYAEQAVNTGTATWPTLTELEEYGNVMDYGIPKNPYQTNTSDSIVTGVTKGTIVGVQGGWAYNPKTGEIWMNTSARGENNW